MKLIIIALLYIPICFSAQKITNFYSNFISPNGDGSFSSFKLDDLEYQNVEFQLKSTMAGLEVLTNDPLVQVPELPSFVNELLNFEVTNFNLENGFNTKSSVEFKSAALESVETYFSLDELESDCEGVSESEDTLISIIEKCIIKGNLDLDKLVYRSGESNSVGFSEVDLDILDGAFELKGRLKYLISGNLKVIGDVSLNDANEVLSIKIDDARVSRINVKKRIFKLLEGLDENEKISVVYPYVHIDLSQSDQ